MFFGKHPPRGFSERPGARFLLPSDSIVNAVPPAGLRTGNTPYTGMPAISPPAGAELRRSTRWSERTPAPLPCPTRTTPAGALHAAADDGELHDPEGTRRLPVVPNPETGTRSLRRPAPSPNERRAHARTRSS